MPLYDFRCGACGRRFERRLTLTAADHDATCECGETAVRVIAGAPALRGSASTPPARADLPDSLAGVAGSRERVAHYQRQEEQISRREQREGADLAARLPVSSHEGPGGVTYMAARAAPPAPAARPTTAER